jgi:hypothetical protein
MIAAGVLAAGAQHRDNVALSSYAKARSVLDAGIEAMGGVDVLLALGGVHREMQGVRTDEGQGLVPADTSHNQPHITATLDLKGPRTSVRIRDIILGGQRLDFVSILTPAETFSADFVHKTLRASKPGPTTIIPQLRRYPEGLLRAAYSRPETLRWIGDSIEAGRKQQVIAYADADGVTVNLAFDAGTRLLAKAETIFADSVRGDSTTEFLFSDYRPVGGLRLPHRHVERVGGSVLQDLKVAPVLDLPGDAFTPPHTFTAVQPRPPEPIVNLADGVFVITGGYNSLAVVFPEYIVVLEGGGNNPTNQNAIDLIKKTVPGKPLK